MKVLTKLMQAELLRQHEASVKDWHYRAGKATVVAKLYDPATGASWYVFEGYPAEDGFRMYCYADSGSCGEYQYEYLTIADLYDTSIKRDAQYTPEKVAELERRLVAAKPKSMEWDWKMKIARV